MESCKKGVSAARGSLPEELCSTGTSTAQGQQQCFECIGCSLSHHLSPSQHPLPLPLLSVPLSAGPSMFINSYNKIPAIITPVNSLGHSSHSPTGVQYTDVQKRIEWTDSFICLSTHRMKCPVLYIYVSSQHLILIVWRVR